MKRRAGEEVSLSEEFVAQLSSFLQKIRKKAVSRQKRRRATRSHLFHLEGVIKFCGSICAMVSDGAAPEGHEHSVGNINYADDIKELLPLYINAFENQKQYANVSMATGEEHRSLLRSMFSVRLSLQEQMHDERTIAIKVTKDGKIIGAGAIVPNSCKASTMDWILAGIYLLPFNIGFFPFLRAMKMGGSTSETEIDPSGGKVVMMAVEPTLHGQGIGSKILKDLLERWENDLHGGDLILLTQLESCVKFYENHGFLVSATVAREGYSNYSMIRRRTKAASNAGIEVPVPEQTTNGAGDTVTQADNAIK